jgi:hypothetical protein
METFSPNTIFAPAFSSNELCKVAGIDRKLANLWMERGVIEPTRTERLAVRTRPHFSCVGIFKARLTRELSDLLDIGTSTSRIPGLGAEVADNPSISNGDIRRVVHVAASPGWMHGSARAVERGKPLNFYAGFGRSDKCWEFRMDTNVDKLVAHFGDISFVLMPIGSIFDGVYLSCKSLIEGRGAKARAKE